MKKSVFIMVTSFFIANTLTAQADTFRTSNYTKGKSNAASFGINIPMGEFSETHLGGISLHYSWSHHRFGGLNKLPKKWISFTVNGGIDYYFGKKETVTGYDFRYGGYTNFFAFGGAIYNPCKKGNISLTTGPAMSIYKGNAEIGFGIIFNGNYYFNDRIAITPGVMYLKFAEANALWAASLKATYTF